MGLTYSDLQIQKNTSAWITSGGIHVTALFPTLGVVSGQNQPPAPFYLFEGDNNANAKFNSRPMPADGQNPNVSTYWECWMQTSATMWFIICNQQTTQIASASIRGYGVLFQSAGNVNIYRLDGGGVVVNLAGDIVAPNTNLVRVRLSREISGANRFWRVYYNNMTTPLVAAVNDATYNNFSWLGFDHGVQARLICGGESCRS